uniref:Uncharacterized protein n=1 Tax=Oryza brachyantha TaxID=4533 RepID=J3MAU0_ORYBR
MQNHRQEEEELEEEEEEEEEKPAFRWFDLVVIIVAGAVGFVAMAVLVGAAVLMRPHTEPSSAGQLEIQVVRGAVFVSMGDGPRPPSSMTFSFHFVASNPMTNLQPGNAKFTGNGAANLIGIYIHIMNFNTSMPGCFRVGGGEDDDIVGVSPGKKVRADWVKTVSSDGGVLGSYFLEVLLGRNSTLITMRLYGKLSSEEKVFSSDGSTVTRTTAVYVMYTCEGVDLTSGDPRLINDTGIGVGDTPCYLSVESHIPPGGNKNCANGYLEHHDIIRFT